MKKESDYIRNYDSHQTDVLIAEVYDPEFESFNIQVTIDAPGNDKAIFNVDTVDQLAAVRDAIASYLKAKAGRYFGIDDSEGSAIDDDDEIQSAAEPSPTD